MVAAYDADEIIFNHRTGCQLCWHAALISGPGGISPKEDSGDKRLLLRLCSRTFLSIMFPRLACFVETARASICWFSTSAILWLAATSEAAFFRYFSLATT